MKSPSRLGGSSRWPHLRASGCPAPGASAPRHAPLAAAGSGDKMAALCEAMRTLPQSPSPLWQREDSCPQLSLGTGNDAEGEAPRSIPLLQTRKTGAFDSSQIQALPSRQTRRRVCRVCFFGIPGKVASDYLSHCFLPSSGSAFTHTPLLCSLILWPSNWRSGMIRWVGRGPCFG